MLDFQIKNLIFFLVTNSTEGIPISILQMGKLRHTMVK
jgi:hypothetical protein